MCGVSYPRIEPHVHLEGTVRPAALLQIARRDGVALPADSVSELAAVCEFRDFPHVLEVCWLTTLCRIGDEYRWSASGASASEG